MRASGGVVRIPMLDEGHGHTDTTNLEEHQVVGGVFFFTSILIIRDLS
jgi:hypothetical protein